MTPLSGDHSPRLPASFLWSRRHITLAGVKWWFADAVTPRQAVLLASPKRMMALALRTSAGVPPERLRTGLVSVTAREADD